MNHRLCGDLQAKVGWIALIHARLITLETLNNDWSHEREQDDECQQNKRNGHAFH